MRFAVLAFALVVMLAACGGTASTEASPSRSASSAASSPAGLTSAQGTQICKDLLAWSNVAYNEDMPRFSQTLTSDEATAGDSQLGQDMTTMDNDLPNINSLAFEPGPPGMPSDGQALAYDCQQYGVTISHWGPPVHQ